MRSALTSIICLCLLTVVHVASAQQYIPLEVGNRWDFIGSYYDAQTHESARDTLTLRILDFGRQANRKNYYEMEQCRIVAKVDELMALVDELEARLAASRAVGEKLLDALVAELTAAKESRAAVIVRSRGERSRSKR